MLTILLPAMLTAMLTALDCVPVQKQKPQRVKAIYNCSADRTDELTFREGEVIVVDGEEDSEWWVSPLVT